jgi:transcriptional regulator with XRE-family HTH domain
MNDEAKGSAAEARNLGLYLRKARDDKGMSLRAVEAATEKEVSNAYLSQLESGKIAKPSPHILFALSEALSVEYDELMRRAGYLTSAKNTEEDQKHGSAATFAIENLSSGEEAALLKYLKFIRKEGHD